MKLRLKYRCTNAEKEEAEALQRWARGRRAPKWWVQHLFLLGFWGLILGLYTLQHAITESPKNRPVWVLFSVAGITVYLIIKQ